MTRYLVRERLRRADVLGGRWSRSALPAPAGAPSPSPAPARTDPRSAGVVAAHEGSWVWKRGHTCPRRNGISSEGDAGEQCGRAGQQSRLSESRPPAPSAVEPVTLPSRSWDSAESEISSRRARPSPASTPDLSILSNKISVSIQPRAWSLPPAPGNLSASVFLDLRVYLFNVEQLIPGKQRSPKLLPDPRTGVSLAGSSSAHLL